MKKSIIFLFNFLLFCGGLQAQKMILSSSEIPSPISNYVSTNFPGIEIEYAVWDNQEYEVTLGNRIELEFEKNFNIKEIDSEVPLPQTVIPPMIWKYVSVNFPSLRIYSWKKIKRGQKIELNNGYDLFFDLRDHFIKMEY